MTDDSLTDERYFTFAEVLWLTTIAFTIFFLGAITHAYLTYQPPLDKFAYFRMPAHTTKAICQFTHEDPAP